MPTDLLYVCHCWIVTTVLTMYLTDFLFLLSCNIFLKTTCIHSTVIEVRILQQLRLIRFVNRQRLLTLFRAKVSLISV